VNNAKHRNMGSGRVGMRWHAPSSTTAVVTNIVITNTATGSATYRLLLDDVSIATDVLLAANDSIVIDMKQVLATTETIKGLASATTVNFHISGVEIA
jgi:hypothetical protein